MYSAAPGVAESDQINRRVAVGMTGSSRLARPTAKPPTTECNMKQLRVLTITASLALVVAAVSNAAILSFTNKTDFLAANTVQATYTFDEPGLRNQGDYGEFKPSLDVGGGTGAVNGVTFDGGLQPGEDQYPGAVYVNNWMADSSNNYFPNYGVIHFGGASPLSIFFGSGVNAFGFDGGMEGADVGKPVSFDIYHTGGSKETFSFSPGILNSDGSYQTWFGFSTGSASDYITSVEIASAPVAPNMDNFVVASFSESVPEPSTFGLAALGAVVLAGWRRARRQA
jgi:hypothetical protein